MPLEETEKFTAKAWMARARRIGAGSHKGGEEEMQAIKRPRRSSAK